MDRQDKVFMRLKKQPLENFGRREINIIFGSSREITKYCVNGGCQVYQLTSNDGSIKFYFKGRKVEVVG